jgi:hypothetical protein
MNADDIIASDAYRAALRLSATTLTRWDSGLCRLSKSVSEADQM